uniref:CRAL-TRIO domain-containing protein n=1 Tax=Glossina brevipalpis TaxID=37001 RepID=A0A1A9X071_9MUSC
MLSVVDVTPCIQVGNVKLSLELGEPSARSKEVAQRELRECPENREKGLQEIKKLLDADPDLKYPREDRFLIRFLRVCKYYPESAAELVKNYFSFKVKHANMFDDLLPSKEENTFKHNVCVAFKNRDQNNRRILVLRLGKKWKHKEVALDDIFKSAVLYVEAAVTEEDTQINGAVVIFDMDGLSLQQTWQFTPAFAKRLIDWLQDSLPLRLKAIHIINQPKIFNVVFSLFKPFLREKLSSRIIFHGTERQSFHRYISPECLPPEYGGTNTEPMIDAYDWYKMMMMIENEYKTINSYGYKK